MEIVALTWVLILTVYIWNYRREIERWTDDAAEEMNRLKSRIAELERRS